MEEVFIQSRGSLMEDTERTIKAIESISGRILHSYPPNIIVALIAPQDIDQLRGKPGIESVDTDEISDERLQQAPGNRGLAIRAWNEHIRAKKHPSSDASTDLAWDALGRLPPDIPLHLREPLQERGREIKDNS